MSSVSVAPRGVAVWVTWGFVAHKDECWRSAYLDTWHSAGERARAGTGDTPLIRCTQRIGGLLEVAGGLTWAGGEHGHALAPSSRRRVPILP